MPTGSMNDSRYSAAQSGGGRSSIPTREPTAQRLSAPQPGQDTACTRRRLIDLGMLNSSIAEARIQFTDSRMVIVTHGGEETLRQESVYEVSEDSILYRIIRATGTIVDSGSEDVPVSTPGPHTEAYSIADGILSLGHGWWR